MTVEPWVVEALDRGLRMDEFEIHLQPVVWLDSGLVFGAESFMRWRHPERGIVPAMAWIPHAATTGELVRCTRSFLPVWTGSPPAGRDLVVSFNFDGQQLRDDDLMSAVLDLPVGVASVLAVEIHHRQFLVDCANAIGPDWEWVDVPDLAERLAALQARGFRVWLDDFGDGVVDEGPVGLPGIDVVKLDKSQLEMEAETLTALVGRIHALDKLVIVEGVENDHDRALAVEAGIDLAQGFLYAPPLNEAQFAEYVTASGGAAGPDRISRG